MKIVLTSAALAASLITFGVVATAQTGSNSTTAMPAHMATLLCRPADAGETASAMATGSHALVCSQLDMVKLMGVKKSLDAMPNGAGEPVWLQMLNMLPVGNGRGS
jgi:hypothetical protein